MTFLNIQPITGAPALVMALAANPGIRVRTFVSVPYENVEEIEKEFINSCNSGALTIDDAIDLVQTQTLRGQGNTILHGPNITPRIDNLTSILKIVELPYLGSQMYVCYVGSSVIDGGAFYCPLNGSTHGVVTDVASQFIVKVMEHDEYLIWKLQI